MKGKAKREKNEYLHKAYWSLFKTSKNAFGAKL